MKRAGLVILMIALVLCFSLMTGCNRTDTETTTAPGSPDVTTADTTADITADEGNTTPQNTEGVYVVTEEDDLEIMTVPADVQGNDEGKDDKDENSETLIQTQPYTQNILQEDTRIELPFIPAN